MTSRTAPRKRAAAGSATEPRHAPKSAPLDAGRRVQRRGMRRNRHRATRAENRIARFHRGALSDRERGRRASPPAESKSLPGKHHPTTMRWPPVRDTPKGERRTRKHEARVVDLKSDHAEPSRAGRSPQRIPLTSLGAQERHTMGEFVPDGRYCLHDSGGMRGR